jgi:rare lipoprotein A
MRLAACLALETDAMPIARITLALLLILQASAVAPAAQPRPVDPAAAASRPAAGLDHSGRTRRGKASYYSHHLAGRTMANGEPMNPDSNTAASKTLPLGTKARVTNLRNGRSTVVVIRDRGPYAKGRIIDLSPSTARALGLGRSGVTSVEVAPIEVPQPDGSVKPGAGADERRNPGASRGE